MGTRKTKRLSPGDLAPRNPDESFSVYNARVELLVTTERLLPRFVSTLADEAFPEYERLVNAHPEIGTIELHSWCRFRSLPPRPEFKAFVGVLKDWARDFNAGEDWVFAFVWGAFQAWRRSEASRGSLLYQLPFGKYGAWAGFETSDLWQSEKLQFEWQPWRPQFESWKSYRTTLCAAFKKAVGEFEKKTLAEASAHGFIDVPRTQLTVQKTSTGSFCISSRGYLRSR